MSIYATGAFWAATAERAVKTAAQSFVGSVGVTAVLSEINWEVVGGVTAVAALLSVGTSIASAKIGGEGPSLGAEVVVEKE
jgi:hypothetical protein